MNEKIILAWKPKNPSVFKRGPGVVTAKLNNGEKGSFAPEFNATKARWEFECPHEVASFCLSQEPGKFFLVSPSKLTITGGSLSTGYQEKVVESIDTVTPPSTTEDEAKKKADLEAKKKADLEAKKEVKKQAEKTVNENGGAKKDSGPKAAKEPPKVG